MRRAQTLLATLLGAALASSCNGTPGFLPACDAMTLTEALAAALPGNGVRVGACEVEGNFVVPAGVTLMGIDPATSAVHATSGTALTLMTGAMPTGVTGLNVVSDGAAAITAVGTGTEAVTLSGVKVRATHGYGVGAEGLATLTASDVTITGPVTSSADAIALVTPITPGATATHGLVVVGVASAMLSNVAVDGFAQFGAVFARMTTATWHGGNASQNAGTGILVDASTVTLDTVSLVGTYKGTGTAYAGVVAHDGTLTTVGATVSNNEGFGLVQDGGSADHTNLVARSNASPAVWLQNVTTSFHVHGATTDVGGNGGAGIVAVASSHVTLEDAHVYGTHLTTVGGTMMADGIELAGAVDAVTLLHLRVENCARVNVLADAGAAAHTVSSLTITAVTVNGTGPTLGAIDQDGMFATGWDAGVTRMGATIANDAGFDHHALGVASPLTTLPNVDAITMHGLAALL